MSEAYYLSGCNFKAWAYIIYDQLTSEGYKSFFLYPARFNTKYATYEREEDVFSI